MSPTKRCSQAVCLSRSVLMHGPRQAHGWLIFDVSQKNYFMKHIIQNLAHTVGYHISKVEGPTTHSGAFAEMQRLCENIGSPTIFDVGAHHGDTVMEFRSRFPTSRILAFEPFQESFQVLCHNTKADSGIQVFNYGLADQSGIFSFHSNPSSATNSLLPTDDMGPNTWGAGLLETKGIVQAHFRSIDSIVKELDIRKIDILKLDVQGAEYRVLQGALEACRDGIVSIVYSEIITQPTYKGQKRLDEALSVFYSAGFDLHNIFNLCSTSDRKLCQFDAIFTRTKNY